MVVIVACACPTLSLLTRKPRQSVAVGWLVQVEALQRTSKLRKSDNTIMSYLQQPDCNYRKTATRHINTLDDLRGISCCGRLLLSSIINRTHTMLV